MLQNKESAKSCFFAVRGDWRPAASLNNLDKVCEIEGVKISPSSVAEGNVSPLHFFKLGTDAIGSALNLFRLRVSCCCVAA